MKIIEGGQSYHLDRGAVLTIGNFDGLHVGHKKLIDSVIQSADATDCSSLLYTFDPHPSHVLSPDKKTKRLCSTLQLKQMLSQLGLDALIIETFSEAFSKLSPMEFIKKHIVDFIQPSLIVVGHDFRFGANNEGSSELLQKLGQHYQFAVKIIAPVRQKGLIVSSSLIRSAVASGKWDLVSHLLGRPFSIIALVSKGKGLAQKLGFPTINLQVEENQLLPANGVYIARLKVKNQLFQSVVNIGVGPTFSSKGLKKIEIHVIEKNIQWQEPKCEFEILQYIRPEKKFSHSRELIHQIKKDIQVAKRYFQIF